MLEEIPVTPAEDEAFASLLDKISRHRARHRAADAADRITDESIHLALCVEEGCARCAR